VIFKSHERKGAIQTPQNFKLETLDVDLAKSRRAKLFDQRSQRGHLDGQFLFWGAMY